MTKLFRRLFNTAGTGSVGVDSVAPRADANSLIGELAHPGHNQSFNVAPIRNGFLLLRRTYNPNGPDRIDAVYAASAEEIGPLLVAELAASRITK